MGVLYILMLYTGLLFVFGVVLYALFLWVTHKK